MEMTNLQERRKLRREVLALTIEEVMSKVSLPDAHYGTEDYDAIAAKILEGLTNRGHTMQKARDNAGGIAHNLTMIAQHLDAYVDAMGELSKMAAGPLATLGPGGDYTRDIMDAGNKDGANR